MEITKEINVGRKDQTLCPGGYSNLRDLGSTGGPIQETKNSQ